MNTEKRVSDTAETVLYCKSGGNIQDKIVSTKLPCEPPDLQPKIDNGPSAPPRKALGPTGLSMVKPKSSVIGPRLQITDSFK